MSRAVETAARIMEAHALVLSAGLVSSRSQAERHGHESGLVMVAPQIMAPEMDPSPHRGGASILSLEAAFASIALGIPERWSRVWERAYAAAAWKRARLARGVLVVVRK